MPGLRLGTFGGTTGTVQATTAPSRATSVTSAAFGPGYTMSPPSTKAALWPNDPAGIAFWTGIGGIGGLWYLRHTLPTPMKKNFDLVIIMLILWVPAKGLAKAVAARHASSDSGIAQDAAKAAVIVL
jgi:hypothetical protein